jgi:hypothetical protein
LYSNSIKKSHFFLKTFVDNETASQLANNLLKQLGSKMTPSAAGEP